MDFSRVEDLVQQVDSMKDELGALQIKVGALESIVLNNDEIRAMYTQIVNEQADQLLRERRNRSANAPANPPPRGKLE